MIFSKTNYPISTRRCVITYRTRLEKNIFCVRCDKEISEGQSIHIGFYYESEGLTPEFFHKDCSGN